MGAVQERREAYGRAQNAILELKAAVLSLLSTAPSDGMKNCELGRSLGLYMGYGGQHQGCLMRTILDLLEQEGSVVKEPDSQAWSIRTHLD